jgi:hypothetical protein
VEKAAVVIVVVIIILLLIITFYSFNINNTCQNRQKTSMVEYCPNSPQTERNEEGTI